MPPESASAELDVVTGGAGFIGSHLVEALLARGRRVRIVDDFSSGSPRRVPNAAELVIGDVLERAGEALEGAAVVYHLAAQVSVPRSVRDPLETHRATESGTVAVLDQAERRGVRRVVLASSSAVYGNEGGIPKRESDPPAPASPYALAKWCSELHARHWARFRRLETVSLRFFNVYGPRQDPNSPYAAAIPAFVSRLLAGEALPVFGDGLQTRDFVHVEDVVRGILAAAEAPGASGGVYNIAGGEETSLLGLIEILSDLLQRPARIETLPTRPGDVRRSRADIAAAARDLGYRPRIGLRSGLAGTLAWFREESAPLHCGSRAGA